MRITKRTHYIRTFLRHFAKFVDIDKKLLNFIDNEFKDINEKYKNYKSPTLNSNSNKIWVFWWQGADSMPDIVKICFNSIKRNVINADVVLLDKNNLSQYVELPQYIFDKLNNKSMTITHFSDILRMALLAKHGGMWLDATSFISHPFDINQLPKPFYSIHLPTSSLKVCQGRWTAFCLKNDQGNIISSFVRDIFYAYWAKYSYLPDYYFVDFVLCYGYTHFPEFKKYIDAVPINNTEVFSFMKKFNFKYKENKYQALLNSSNIFKLTYKFTFWKCRKRTIFGQKTIYKKFTEDFGEH